MNFPNFLSKRPAQDSSPTETTQKPMGGISRLKAVILTSVASILGGCGALQPPSQPRQRLQPASIERIQPELPGRDEALQRLIESLDPNNDTIPTPLDLAALKGATGDNKVFTPTTPFKLPRLLNNEELEFKLNDEGEYEKPNSKEPVFALNGDGKYEDAMPELMSSEPDHKANRSPRALLEICRNKEASHINRLIDELTKLYGVAIKSSLKDPYSSEVTMRHLAYYYLRTRIEGDPLHLNGNSMHNSNIVALDGIPEEVLFSVLALTNSDYYKLPRRSLEKYKEFEKTQTPYTVEELSSLDGQDLVPKPYAFYEGKRTKVTPYKDDFYDHMYNAIRTPHACDTNKTPENGRTHCEVGLNSSLTAKAAMGEVIKSLDKTGLDIRGLLRRLISSIAKIPKGMDREHTTEPNQLVFQYPGKSVRADLEKCINHLDEYRNAEKFIDALTRRLKYELTGEYGEKEDLKILEQMTD